MGRPVNPFRPDRLRLVCGAVLLGAAAAGALLYRGSLVVRAEGNDPLPALPFTFLHESLDHPVLGQLRREEALDEVVAPALDRMDALVRLRHWTHSQIPYGEVTHYPPWDATVILEWIREGVTPGLCGQYAQVYAQACLALGWRPRYVEIGPRTNPIEHFTTEVWVDPLAKWVHLDATHDVHFEAGGVPLSTLEVHQALVEGRLDQVIVRRGLEGTPVEGEERRRMLEFFYYLRFGFKMDHLSAPFPPFDRKLHWVDWNDRWTVPWESSEEEASDKTPHIRTAGYDVSEPRLFDFPLHRVHVAWSADRFRHRVVLEVAHDMPDFDHYLVRYDGGAWEAFSGEELEVAVGGEGLAVEIVAVSRRGVVGVPAKLDLSWWKGW